MRRHACRLGWAGFVLLVFALGCSKPAGPPDRGEGPVRERFKELQTALKAKDADQLWGMLCGKSRADAEQAAKDIRAAYEEAGAEEKAKQEKSLGLPGAELSKLTGPGVLKTQRFLRKYEEVPDSAIDRVTVQGDNATVYFTEPDGDKEKTIFLREDRQWKAWLAMPKARRP